MDRVLIVAKTHMHQGYVCIGGLNLSTNTNVRLLLPGPGNHSQNHPSDTPFHIGQIWNMELQPKIHFEPPHVEDMIIIEKSFIGKEVKMRETLLQRITPWQGDFKNLFEGCLQFTEHSAYISR